MKKVYLSAAIALLSFAFMGKTMAQNYNGNMNFSTTFPGKTSFNNYTFGFTNGTTNKVMTIDVNGITFTNTTFNISNGNKLVIQNPNSTTMTVNFGNNDYVFLTSSTSAFNISSSSTNPITVNFNGTGGYDNIDISGASSAITASAGTIINISNGTELDISAHNNSTAPTTSFTSSTINISGGSTFDITASQSSNITNGFNSSSINIKDNSSMSLNNNNSYGGGNNSGINNTLNMVNTDIVVGDIASGNNGTASLNLQPSSLIAISDPTASSIRLAYKKNFIQTPNTNNTATAGSITGPSSFGTNKIYISGYYPNGYPGTTSRHLTVPYGTTGTNYPTNLYAYTNSVQYVYGPSVSSINTATFAAVSPLPVILVDFNAVLHSDKSVYVSWSTQQEVNSSHFDVERSADGVKWEAIGTVQAKGNSPLVNVYSYTDQSPFSGINYYRLKMVDIDNRYGYTEIKAVRTTATFGISVFPNPAKDFVNVSISKATSDLSIRMINQLGQVMQETKVSNGTTTIVSMPTHNYPQGTYMLQIKGSDGTQQTSKVLVIK